MIWIAFLVIALFLVAENQRAQIAKNQTELKEKIDKLSRKLSQLGEIK